MLLPTVLETGGYKITININVVYYMYCVNIFIRSKETTDRLLVVVYREPRGMLWSFFFCVRKGSVVNKYLALRKLYSSHPFFRLVRIDNIQYVPWYVTALEKMAFEKKIKSRSR